jgi:hypothetical protein
MEKSSVNSFPAASGHIRWKKPVSSGSTNLIWKLVCNILPNGGAERILLASPKHAALACPFRNSSGEESCMKKITKVAVAAILLAPLAACGTQEADQAAEETGEAVEATGEAVDAAAEEAVDAAEGAADAAGDAAAEAGDKMKDAAGDAAAAAGDAAEKAGDAAKAAGDAAKEATK